MSLITIVNKNTSKSVNIHFETKRVFTVTNIHPVGTINWLLLAAIHNDNTYINYSY